ncbi:MAG TPA: branched-chain amino acid ABC transporter permease [Stellaceae bacterium]|nr:branched-chain amino acid ABC transporter permease [Stellaceae bacterium]
MLDLFLNAIASGVLLGGFYAVMTVGLAISFGMLDVGNLAHPAFVILGSFTAYILNSRYGIDPIVAGIIVLPGFALLGAVIYETYYWSFERRGEEGVRGLSFFFGLLFITEVALILIFGVDYRFVEAPYIGRSIDIGLVDLPLRMLVPCITAFVLIGVLQLFLSRTFIGRAILAVAQDGQALRLMAVSPKHVKRVAFSLSIATAAIAGSCLIIIQPVEPSIGRDYIGRVFAVTVMGGMGSFPGMVIAALVLGIVESLTATFYGPSWSPAVAFGFLLLTLAFRPSGIMGR